MSHAFIDSEWSYRELLEGIGVGVLVAEVRTRRFLYANPAVCKLLGYTAEELTNLSVSELHPPGELPRIIQDFEAQFRGEKLLAADAPCLRKDGSIVYCDISSSTKTVGSVDCLVGVFFDITARKQAEEALRESETRLQALSDNLPGGLVYQIDTGMDGLTRRFTYLSAGVEALHGVTAAEVMQDPMKIYGQIPEEDQAEVAHAEASAITSMTPFSAEVRIRMPDGNVRWRLFCSAPRRFANGQLIWDGIEVDITSRKRVEVELLEKSRLESQLRQAQKLESIGRLAGGVAHDFNNMLGVILGHTELAMEQMTEDNSLLSDLGEIRAAATRSADLTRQLLAFARKQTITPRSLDLNEIATRIHSLLSRLIGENIELVFEPSRDLWRVHMDPSQVEQILTNLFVNARDAISGVGRIFLSTDNCTIDAAFREVHPEAVEGDYVRIIVTDTGSGMDSSTLARIFEPFFTTKAFGQGTGLGLATVYGIVQQNNGFILVESDPGQGTEFHIHLPRSSVPAEKEAAIGPVPKPGNAQETVLLVEDEPSVLHLTQRILSQEGYVVIKALTPQEAIRKAREHQGEIHLLITDVIMPEMNGQLLARSLNALFPSLRCLFMSGYTADIVACQGVLEDGVAFLQKPFSSRILLDKVREVLSGPA